MSWTLLDFASAAEAAPAQLQEAEENLRGVENRVRVEIEKEMRKVRRTEHQP